MRACPTAEDPRSLPSSGCDTGRSAPAPLPVLRTYRYNPDMTCTDDLLYERDFDTRPLAALALGMGCAIAVLVAAVVKVPLLAFAAIPFLAAGVAGYLRATRRLEVAPGQVTTSSCTGTHTYEASALTLERRDASNVYVLAKTAKRTGVVCVFSDVFAESTREAFAAAGVAIAVDDPRVDALARNGQHS